MRKLSRFGSLAVLAGVLALGTRVDAGAVVAWGDDYHGQVSNTPTGTDFTAIAAGDSTGFALRADGSIAVWGPNYYGQVSNAPMGTDFTAIAAGTRTSYALRADGSIAAWGSDEYGAVSKAPTGSGFTAIAGGYYTGYALTAPEPASLALLALGTTALLARRRNTQR